ncbi:MAG: hypothetical protein M4579_006443 [Chaenotheca gracillima]|nr:MAG: hypothetical protein M4579_006443 [Chaenotheca gracillima]
MQRHYLLLCLATVARAQTDFSQYVLPFLGTEAGGNMFPGVTRPYGTVRLGPDLSTGSDVYAGYASTGSISGFSMMHESGTGGAPKYGTVSQMPFVGSVPNPLTDVSDTRASSDQAQVGSYKSSLTSGITVELAATDHAALYQYTFPQNQQGNVLVNVSHVLPSYRGLGLSQNYRHGNITILQDGHYEGSGTYNNGWNLAPDWNIYFCGRFDTRATSSSTYPSSYGSKSASSNDEVGAIFSFRSQTVKSRVGISWISSAKACQFLDAEIPANTALQTVESGTKTAWNDQVLSSITTTETDTTNLQLLYSYLYGMLLMPTNRTGENPLWSSSEPYYDDVMTFWDLFRSHTPLMHVLQPTAYEELVRSVIDTWRHDNYMPDARSSNFNGRTQGGSNADNVLADAYVKGVRGEINWGDGYKAMVKDAEVQPANNNDPEAPDSSTKEGRGALPDWRAKGYITPTYSRAVSRAAEYAANDFGLYQVASGEGISSDANKYLSSSRNWQNHWNPSATSLGFNGFLVPVDSSGAFQDQDPLDCGGCYWGDAYYEGLPWGYSFTPLHSMATIVQLSGGPDRFVQKLDKAFQGGQDPGASTAFNQTIFDPTNEPDFAMPYLYHFAGRPELSVTRARTIAKAYYSTSVSGLPGNSDAGAMQSWLLWNIIGLYPVTGQTTFLIASPWFSSLTLALSGSKTVKITSTGGNSDTAYHVQSLKVNGRAWTQSWLVWDDIFANGGTMDFVLGSEPQDWTNGGALPPSPASQTSTSSSSSSSSTATVVSELLGVL